MSHDSYCTECHRTISIPHDPTCSRRTAATTEKPLPDAPGWWIARVGHTNHLVVLSAESIGRDAVRLVCPNASCWYGPIALPWEAK